MMHRPSINANLKEQPLPGIVRKQSARRVTSPILGSNLRPVNANHEQSHIDVPGKHSSKDLRARRSQNFSPKDTLSQTQQLQFAYTSHIGTREDAVEKLSKLLQSNAQIRKAIDEYYPTIQQPTLKRSLLSDTVLITNSQKILGQRDKIEPNLVQGLKQRIQYEGKMERYRRGLEEKENRITNMIESRLSQLKKQLRPK